MSDKAIREAIASAVRKALNEMGLDRFKETSFFVSNVTVAKKPQKKAA
ncbi:hypothetical protein [Methylocystis sp. S23]